MPQPVLKYTDLRIHPHAIAHHSNPKFASQITIIAFEWNAAEVQLGQHLTDFLGAHAEVAALMFLALRSAEAKSDVLKAVVEPYLPRDAAREFEQLLKNLASARKSRNDVIHGMWGVSNDYPNDVILADTRELLLNSAIFTKMSATQDWGQLGEVVKLKKLMRYNERDFGEIIRRIRKARLGIPKLLHRYSARS